MNSNHRDRAAFDVNSPLGSRRAPSTNDGGTNTNSFQLPVVTPTAEERGRAVTPSYALASGGSDAPPPPAATATAKIVELDVGGFKFTTSRDTLCRVVGSHLEAMFSGRHSMETIQKGDGSYFIDRDGRHFHHILNFLRAGSVITLPVTDQFKEELAIEADFFGLDSLVKAIRMPKMDLLECVPEEVLAHWEAEADLRIAFADGTAKEFSKIDPFRGLIPLFPTPGHENECLHTMPLKYNPDSELLRRGQGTLFMNNIRSTGEAGQPVTVKDVQAFKRNFNKGWPNILHRLQEVLLEEPVIIAGGAVLRALTASKGIRTADWWETENRVVGNSDIDIFVYGCDRESANRIARRIFYALALDAEARVVVRARGVVNIHNFVNSMVETKVQIVLRIYDSPSEVLIGFDLDSCCCAYDGRNVWVCPRWISSIETGLNILNPLHTWPNKPSYEFRLAKYAFRGFSVLVPGIDNNRIDYNLIHRSDLRDLKGMARFLKISSEMETAPIRIRNQWYRGVDGIRRIERPRTPREIATLRSEEIGTVSEDLRLVEVLDLAYDGASDHAQKVVVPAVYEDGGGDIDWLWLHHLSTLRARDTRDEAWEEILDAGEDHPTSVKRCLIDAWDTEKRSREYLNSHMSKYDLDNLYYSKAYNEDEAGK